MDKRGRVLFVSILLLVIFLISNVMAVPQPPPVPSMPNTDVAPQTNVDDDDPNVNGGGGKISGFYISSIPSGADVFINDVNKGVTPKTIRGLAINREYTILVTKEGYKDYTTKETAEIGINNITITLEKENTQLSPDTNNANQQNYGAQNNNVPQTNVPQSGGSNIFVLASIVGGIILFMVIAGILVFVMTKRKNDSGNKVYAANQQIDPRLMQLSYYIRSNISRGYHPMQIHDFLMRYGWSDAQINQAFQLLR